VLVRHVLEVARTVPEELDDTVDPLDGSGTLARVPLPRRAVRHGQTGNRHGRIAEEVLHELREGLDKIIERDDHTIPDDAPPSAVAFDKQHGVTWKQPVMWGHARLAGNEGWTRPRPPAGYPGVLAVVEPTISISLWVEALHDRRDYGDARKQPRSGTFPNHNGALAVATPLSAIVLGGVFFSSVRSA
jgi:hypothetical protein